MAAWSQFTDGRNLVADPVQVNNAITWIDSYVNQTLANSPYLTPIQPLDGSTMPQEIVEPAALMAGLWLFRARKLNASKEVLADMQKQWACALRQLWAIRVGVTPIQAIFNQRRSNVPQTRGYRSAH